MSRDIYTGYHGAMTAWRQLEVVSNNVANLSTHGFKAQDVRFVVDANPPDGELSPTRAAIEDIGLDLSEGSLERTGDPLHVAVTGQGWLVVDGGGEELLTRNGKLQMSEDGTLLAAGLPLLGEDGPLQVDPSLDLSIDQLGNVSQAGEVVGRIRLAAAEELEPLGVSTYRPVGALQDATGSIEPGHLERSNVNPMEAMVDLIMASRRMEIAQKALQASEEMDRTSARNGSPK
ncbi:MAG: flagellar hook basal-body protein [Myxococcota bacterium]|nr:flagellar hook basal-body protein [Myxococcota bacterium]